MVSRVNTPSHASSQPVLWLSSGSVQAATASTTIDGPNTAGQYPASHTIGDTKSAAATTSPHQPGTNRWAKRNTNAAYAPKYTSVAVSGVRIQPPSRHTAQFSHRPSSGRRPNTIRSRYSSGGSRLSQSSKEMKGWESWMKRRLATIANMIPRAAGRYFRGPRSSNARASRPGSTSVAALT